MSKGDKSKDDIRKMLRAAHDHGYETGASNLGWDKEKSWVEFLKQNNIPIHTRYEVNMQIAQKAIRMKGEGHSLRSIGLILGLPHPQSVKNLIDTYNKPQTPQQ